MIAGHRIKGEEKNETRKKRRKIQESFIKLVTLKATGADFL